MTGMNKDGKLMEKRWIMAGSGLIRSTLGRRVAAASLLGSCLGLLQHGRAVTSEAV